MARALDFLALRLVTLAACYLWFSSLVRNSFPALALSILSVTLISLIMEIVKGMRLDKFKLREYDRIKREIFRMRLLTREKEDIAAFVKRRAPVDAFIERRLRPLCADDMLRVYKAAKDRGLTSAVMVSPSAADESAKKFAEECGMEIEIIPLDSLIQKNDYAHISQEYIDQVLLKRIESGKEQRKKAMTRPFEAAKSRRYILVALGLLAASFFVKHALYYRMLSAACVSFGAAAWWLDHISMTGSSSERL